MSNPYQAPEVDPNLEEEKRQKYPKPKKTNTKLLLLTFTPATILLISIFLIPYREDFFFVAIVGTPILAGLWTILTTIELAKGKTALNIFGILILCACIHFTLLFITLFVGCGVTGNGF